MLLAFFILAIFAHSENLELVIGSNWELQIDNQWYPVTVPGEIYTDLLRYNKIPDPFYGTNEQQVRWVENYDWTYKTTFELSSEMLSREHVDIVFDGLDTFAEVTLNGFSILSADNMFRQWTVDAKRYLSNNNQLIVVLRSPVKKGIDIMKKHDIYCGIGYREDRTFCQSFIRKAPYHFGWDWGPSLITSGIWRPVRLHGYDDFTVSSSFIDTLEINVNSSTLLLSFEILSLRDSSQVNVSLSYNDTNQFWLFNLQSGNNKYAQSFIIDHPTLWWCNTLGKPYLYDYTLCFETSKSKYCKTSKFGVRTIKLVTDKEVKEDTFKFVLNGNSTFIRGANIIPTDSFITRTTIQNITYLLTQAVKSNMNMLRIWGGGVYQSDEFYSICDELGILIWQDFMFACSMYPAYDEFLLSVTKEAEYNIKRLRSHPSVALWVGNNEIWVGYNTWPMPNLLSWKQNDYDEHMKRDYLQIFTKTLLDAVNSNDNFKNYWPSSPLYSTNNNSFLNSGDVHYWSVWSGTPPSPILSYQANVGLFMSEYGFQSMPKLSTIKTFDTNPSVSDPLMANHQKALLGNFRLHYYMSETLGDPHNTSEFVYWTQIMQSYALETAITSHRIAKDKCMGTLYWQINDCWPVVSWATIDYFGNWKPAQYKVRRLYQPAGVLGFMKKDGIEIYFVNDLLENFGAMVELDIYYTNGTLIMNSLVTQYFTANSKSLIFSFSSEEYMSNYKHIAIKTSYTPQVGGNVKNYFFYEDLSEIELVEPEIASQATIENGSYVFRLSTMKVAKNVWIEFEDFVEGEWSDNNVDMVHERVTLVFKPKEVRESIPRFKVWYLMPNKNVLVSSWVVYACIVIGSVLLATLILTIVLIMCASK